MRILTVVDYDEMWPTLFENERTLLQMTLGKVISRIHHIGSTSVPGLSAKPVIDILIEVANLEELDSLNQAMEGVGYTVRGENGILICRFNGCIDADTSGRGIAIPVKRFKRAFYGVERLKNRLNQFLAGCRRGDALGRAIKQANSEPGFQSLQGMTQR